VFLLSLALKDPELKTLMAEIGLSHQQENLHLKYGNTINNAFKVGEVLLPQPHNYTSKIAGGVKPKTVN